MIKPRIAIPVPTSHDPAYNAANWQAYADAVERSGGHPVRVELNLTPAQIAELAGTCSAILLPGSPADVSPGKYGQDRLDTTAPSDAARENVDELLLQDAHNLYKPILAICFGAQILNVWRSGTLVQELTVLPVNHTAPRGVAVAHTVAVAARSLLASIVGPATGPISEAGQDNGARLPVNSSHHQAIGIAGDGLLVSARCPQDGVVEAIEGGQANSTHAVEAGGSLDPAHPAHFVLGVQWHPERTFATDAVSRALFSRLVQEAAAWKPRLIVTSIYRQA